MTSRARITSRRKRTNEEPQDPGTPAPDPDDSWEHRTPEHEAREMRAIAERGERDPQLRTPVPEEFRPKTAGASNKQLNFLASLAQEREMAPEHRDALTARIAAQVLGNEANGDCAPDIEGGISKKRASEFITRLQEKEKRSAPATGSDVKATPNGGVKFRRWEGIPDGRYALPMPGDDLNPIHFYTVRTSDFGDEWDGFQRVKRHASDERYPVKGATRREVLDRIAEDPKASTILFGRETEHCGICGRELTRDDSRAAGIGPKCAEKHGW